LGRDDWTRGADRMRWLPNVSGASRNHADSTLARKRSTASKMNKYDAIILMKMN
jgi:hypothetical protein